MNIPSKFPTLSLQSEVPLDSYSMITIMDGPGVNGLDRYFLGYFSEDLHNDDGSFLARPVGHHELPRPMTLPEIEEWALKHLSIPKETLSEREAQQLREQHAERTSTDSERDTGMDVGCNAGAK
ncbi:hypothetical protein [Haloglomus halophilum]|uniref:hypothetical protein n=1 Tax=Haloglomus halophilum TaxID=2962672 RepID=UPI0020C95151|nr:hypothetical protein [Haloglomus halophilum]